MSQHDELKHEMARSLCALMHGDGFVAEVGTVSLTDEARDHFEALVTEYESDRGRKFNPPVDLVSWPRPGGPW